MSLVTAGNKQSLPVIKIKKKESQTHTIFTVFLFIRLINSFGIDQQSLACSQRGYSVYLARFMGYDIVEDQRING